MERAGRSLGKLKLADKIPAAELARAAWPAAVGQRLAQRAVAVNLVRDRLIVEVEDAIWQKQLFHLKHQILPRLREVIGDGVIGDIEFRIAPQRRPPQTAPSLTGSGAGSTDEADQIADPILRMVYRQARKKATA